MYSEKTVLDRAYAIRMAKPILDTSKPLLREVVNHATHTFVKFQERAAASGLEEDVVLCFLYNHALETTDGLEVLLSHACGSASRPLLRTLLETKFSVEFIFAGDYKKRALSWLWGFIHQRLETLDRRDPSTNKGKPLQEAWDKRIGGYQAPLGVDSERTSLQSALTKPPLASIEQEYLSWKTVDKKNKGLPHWYSLFGGPKNLWELANELERLPEYDLLYRPWSGVSHGTEITHCLAPTNEGGFSFWAGRNPAEIRTPILFTCELMGTITGLMLMHFCPEDKEKLLQWDKKNIEKSRKTLMNVNIQVE